MIEFRKTNRGFSLGEFIDRNGSECSIQNSSLGTEAAIWFGVDRNIDAPRVGESTDYTRMHLVSRHARYLMPLLQRFVDTGTIKENPRCHSKRSFTDRYGSKCIVESVMNEQPELLLGVEMAFTDLASQLIQHPMRLFQEDVENIIPVLRRFINVGSIHPDHE